MLDSALLWKLPASLWEQAQEAIVAVAAAMASSSPAALWQASGYLDLYSPVRTQTRLGDPPVGAPRAVREQIAELVDTLALDVDSRSGSGSTVG